MKKLTKKVSENTKQHVLFIYKHLGRSNTLNKENRFYIRKLYCLLVPYKKAIVLISFCLVISLDYVVGNSSTMLSGGQKEKIALARALIHDNPVVIFDEAGFDSDALFLYILIKF